MAKDLTPAELQAIKARVAKGRLQGGNPTGGDEGPFYLYHLALDDLDTLIGYFDRQAATPGPFQQPASTPLAPLQASGDLGPTRKPNPLFHPEADIQPPRLADLTEQQRADLLRVAVTE